jgi:hypothetical protein
MRIRLIPLGLGLLLVLQGCVGLQQKEPPPNGGQHVVSPELREVAPPRLRYRIQYRRWGCKLVPDFAEIDRSGEYVVVPEEAKNVP